MGFDITARLLIIFFCIYMILDRKWEYNETVHHVLVDFKNSCESVWKEVLCNIVIEVEVQMKLVRFIDMCVNSIQFFFIYVLSQQL
jgi:hypothetical protein